MPLVRSSSVGQKLTKCLRRGAKPSSRESLERAASPEPASPHTPANPHPSDEEEGNEHPEANEHPKAGEGGEEGGEEEDEEAGIPQDGGRAVVEPAPPVGLANVGNTCFMNSALQCLLSVRLLTRYFDSGKFVDEINKTNPVGHGGKLAQAYGKLVAQYRAEFAHGEAFIRPSVFHAELCRFAQQFRGYQQHDSQELVAVLLDGLHEDLNRCTNKPYVEDVEHDGSKHDEDIAAESWANHLMRDKSVIVDLFQGQLKNTLTCLECGRVAIRFDPFMYLSVPLPRSRSALTLEACIAMFSEEERLQGDNQWYCPRCKKHRDATKRMEIWKTPQNLLIHLKRFESNRNGRRNKRTDKVVFPLGKIDLRPFIPPDSHNDDNLVYHCEAVSNHIGSLHGGHYTAFALRGDQWFEFDDSRVAPVPDQRVCTKHAYLLMFSRGHGDMIRRQTFANPKHWPHRPSAADQALQRIHQKQLEELEKAKSKQSPKTKKKKGKKVSIGGRSSGG